MKKFDWNKPFTTQDGKSARRICSDAKYKGRNVVLIEHQGVETAFNYNDDGTWAFGSVTSNYNLVNVVEKTTRTLYVKQNIIRPNRLVLSDQNKVMDPKCWKIAGGLEFSIEDGEIVSAQFSKEV